jgi:hypothetical protein
MDLHLLIVGIGLLSVAAGIYIIAGPPVTDWTILIIPCTTFGILFIISAVVLEHDDDDISRTEPWSTEPT